MYYFKYMFLSLATIEHGDEVCGKGVMKMMDFEKGSEGNERGSITEVSWDVVPNINGSKGERV